MTTDKQVEPWVDAVAVGKHLGFNADHIRKLAVAGKLPGKQLQNGSKKYWRFKMSQVEAFMLMRDAMPLVSSIGDMAAQQ